MYQQQKRRANVTVFDAQTDRDNEMTRDTVGAMCYVPTRKKEIHSGTVYISKLQCVV